MSSETRLENYYKTAHILMSKFGKSLGDIENTIPFENDIFVAMIISDAAKKNH